MRDSMARRESKRTDLRLLQFIGPDKLESVVRSVTLRDEKSIFPYRDAKIEIEPVEFGQITPMALYTMKRRLEENLELYDALMITYALNLWDLPGLLKFRYNSPEEQVISPPLIEVYREREKTEYIFGLVDGLHRCIVAHDLGYKRIRTIVVSNVQYPLVPLPTGWNEIKVFEHNPTRSEKEEISL